MPSVFAKGGANWLERADGRGGRAGLDQPKSSSCPGIGGLGRRGGAAVDTVGSCAADRVSGADNGAWGLGPGDTLGPGDAFVAAAGPGVALRRFPGR